MTTAKAWLVVALGLVNTSGLAQAGAISATKKDLVAKVIQAQQAGVDHLARQIVEQPAVQMLQRAGPVLQARVPSDQREAVARELQGEVRKYVEEALPVVRQRARALAHTALGPLLEEKLTEAELKEVLGILESPTWRKYQGLAPEMLKALGEKVVADVKGQMQSRLKALEQAMSRHLGIAAPAPAASATK